MLCIVVVKLDLEENYATLVKLVMSDNFVTVVLIIILKTLVIICVRNVNAYLRIH